MSVCVRRLCSVSLALPQHMETHTGVNMTYKPTYFQPQLKLHSLHCAAAAAAAYSSSIQ